MKVPNYYVFAVIGDSITSVPVSPEIFLAVVELAAVMYGVSVKGLSYFVVKDDGSEVKIGYAQYD